MNRGAQLLAMVVERTDGKQAGLAEKLGIHQGHMSRLVRGLKDPSTSLRRKIRDICSIPTGAWDDVIEDPEDTESAGAA